MSTLHTHPHTHTHTQPSASFLTKCLESQYSAQLFPFFLFSFCLLLSYLSALCISLLFVSPRNNFFPGAPENACNFHILFFPDNCPPPPPRVVLLFLLIFSFLFLLILFAHFTCPSPPHPSFFLSSVFLSHSLCRLSCLLRKGFRGRQKRCRCVFLLHPLSCFFFFFFFNFLTCLLFFSSLARLCAPVLISFSYFLGAST